MRSEDGKRKKNRLLLLLLNPNRSGLNDRETARLNSELIKEDAQPRGRIENQDAPPSKVRWVSVAHVHVLFFVVVVPVLLGLFRGVLAAVAVVVACGRGARIVGILRLALLLAVVALLLLVVVSRHLHKIKQPCNTRT